MDKQTEGYANIIREDPPGTTPGPASLQSQLDDHASRLRILLDFCDRLTERTERLEERTQKMPDPDTLHDILDGLTKQIVKLSKWAVEVGKEITQILPVEQALMKDVGTLMDDKEPKNEGETPDDQN